VLAQSESISEGQKLAQAPVAFVIVAALNARRAQKAQKKRDAELTGRRWGPAVRELLNRHCAGLTKGELERFSSLGRDLP
jgi:hypothetical protein